jgi:hypothetical protein
VAISKNAGKLLIIAAGVSSYTELGKAKLYYAGAGTKAFLDAMVSKVSPLHKSVKSTLLAEEGDKLSKQYLRVVNLGLRCSCNAAAGTIVASPRSLPLLAQQVR